MMDDMKNSIMLMPVRVNFLTRNTLMSSIGNAARFSQSTKPAIRTTNSCVGRGEGADRAFVGHLPEEQHQRVTTEVIHRAAPG